MNDVNILEQILLNHDITPIRDSESDGSIIGVGSYGTVLKGNYKGNTVAVKIVRPESREPEIWEKILKIDFSPEELKHIPTIYGIFNGWIEREGGTWNLGIKPAVVPIRMLEDNIWHYKIIVMEELVEVSDSLGNILGGERNYIDEIIKSDDHIYGLIKEIFNKTSIFNDITDFNDRKFIFNEVFRAIKEVHVPKELGLDVDTHRGLISRAIYDVIKTELSKRNLDVDYNDGFQISRIVYNYLAGGGVFPQEWYDLEEVEPYWGRIPETSGLVSAFKKMQQAGISYTDLKPENLMMDPQTGDVVIIDVGLYEEENEASDGFIAQNLDYGDRQEMLVSRLEKLKSSLKKINLNKVANAISGLIKVAQEWEEDWDLEAEERMLDPQRMEQEEQAWEERRQQEQQQIADKEKRMRSEQSRWVAPDVEDKGVLTKYEWLLAGDNVLDAMMIGFTLSDERQRLIFDVQTEDYEKAQNAQRELSKLQRYSVEKSFKTFIANNYSIIDKIVSNYGNQKPEYLGSGAYGDAWTLGSGQVLKITGQDPKFAYLRELSMIYGKMPEAQLQNMIHAHGKFNSDDPVLFWAIMERFMPFNEIIDNYKVDMYDLETIIRRAGRMARVLFEGKSFRDRLVPWMVEYHNEFRKRNPLLIFQPENWWGQHFLASFDKKMQVNVTRTANQIAKYIRPLMKEEAEGLESKIPNLSPDWLESLIRQQIISYMSGHYDLHSGNLGLREASGQAYFVYFDA